MVPRLPRSRHTTRCAVRIANAALPRISVACLCSAYCNTALVAVYLRCLSQHGGAVYYHQNTVATTIPRRTYTYALPSCHGYAIPLACTYLAAAHRRDSTTTYHRIPASPPAPLLPFLFPTASPWFASYSAVTCLYPPLFCNTVLRLRTTPMTLWFVGTTLRRCRHLF